MALERLNMYKQFHRAKDIKSAINALQEKSKNIIIAGGTDLMVQFRNQLNGCDQLVDISQIKELAQIRVFEKEISIGAVTTFSEIIESFSLQQELSLLVEAARKIGAPQIRNMGTIGGNICTASGAADLVPCLFALNAKVVLASASGERILPIRDFIFDNRKTAINQEEILTEVIINRLPVNASSAFVKFGLRNSQAISIINSAVILYFDDDVISDASIVVGCAGPKAIICNKASNLLKNRPPSDDLFASAGEMVAEEIAPITDLRGSANYRRHLASTLVIRALKRANDNCINQERD